jgi:hypothetical protein
MVLHRFLLPKLKEGVLINKDKVELKLKLTGKPAAVNRTVWVLAQVKKHTPVLDILYLMGCIVLTPHTLTTG